MISRLKSFLTGNLSWYQVFAFIISLFALYITILIISNLDIGIHFSNLRHIVLLAIMFSFFLALIKWMNPFFFILMNLISGVVGVYTKVGNLLPSILSFLWFSILSVLSRLPIQFSSEEIYAAPAELQNQQEILSQSIQVLFERQKDWLIHFPSSVYDPISLNLTWSIFVWLLTSWVFWYALKKKRAVIAFLPLLITIALIGSSVESSWVGVLFILGMGLLLNILSSQANLEDYWQKMKYGASKSIRGNTIKYAMSVSIVLIFYAGIVTSPKIDEFIDDIRRREQQASNQSQTETPPEESRNEVIQEQATIGPEEVLNETADGWLPNVHLVGDSPDLKETVVFYATVQESDGELAPRYYFRSATYENFTLKGWQNYGKSYIPISPDEQFEISFSPNDQLIYQEVTLARDLPNGNLMYAVGEIKKANVFYFGSYHTKFVNDTYTDLFASVTDAPNYIAYSVVPYYGGNDLRNTTQDYPSWIANKYLQIPNAIPDRVQELALSLTATQPTPYDRVLAIEQYLRRFEYTLDIEAAPRDQDIVDYFLFDLQKGYCDYFSSAMVILTRAAGIPARLATGYLASTYDEETGQFVVTADQAHSWAEVYFPEYGWVTFEPTAGQPALLREDERQIMPENLAFEAQLFNQFQTPEATGFQLKPDNFFILLAEIFALAIFGILTIHWTEKGLLLRMKPKQALIKIYSRIRRMSNRLGIKIHPNDTPLEFSRTLTITLDDLSMNKYAHRLLLGASQKAALIIEVCNQAAYSNRPIETKKVKQAIHFWSYLRWQLTVMGLIVRLHPIQFQLKQAWYRIVGQPI
ncbi:transglutaminase domain-containing protein [bacterium]|nr:transglutaminase domain-containing protein [bacterium]